MLDHHSHTCDFSSADVSWVHAQGVSARSVGFRGSSIHSLREPADGWSSASRNPMSILWEPFRVPTVAVLVKVGNEEIDASFGTSDLY
jgi:hypothetical protein